MREELNALKGYLVELTQMEPAKALDWLKEERLLGMFLRACDRVDEAIKRAYARPAHDVENMVLKLPARYTVKDRIGRTQAGTLASWIRDLPLKSGWTVGLGECEGGEAEIIVRHVSAERTHDYFNYVKAGRSFDNRAEGPDSHLMAQIHD